MIKVMFLVVMGIIGIGVVVYGIKQDDKKKYVAIVFGALILVLTGIIIAMSLFFGQTNETSKPAETPQDMITVNKKKVTLKSGKASLDVLLDKDTELEIKNLKGNVDSIKYAAKSEPQKLNIVFVVPGEYELIAKQNTKKKKEKILVSKPVKKATSVQSSNSISPANIESEMIQPSIEEPQPDVNVQPAPQEIVPDSLVPSEPQQETVEEIPTLEEPSVVENNDPVSNDTERNDDATVE